MNKRKYTDEMLRSALEGFQAKQLTAAQAHKYLGISRARWYQLLEADSGTLSLSKQLKTARALLFEVYRLEGVPGPRYKRVADFLIGESP